MNADHFYWPESLIGMFVLYIIGILCSFWLDWRSWKGQIVWCVRLAWNIFCAHTLQYWFKLIGPSATQRATASWDLGVRKELRSTRSTPTVLFFNGHIYHLIYSILMVSLITNNLRVYSLVLQVQCTKTFLS